jgi:hypothetical protein
MSNIPDLITLDKFLGPDGGLLAIAFAAGCTMGYAFCVRTLYKILKEQKATDHDSCLERIAALERDKEELKSRLTLLEDRLYHGQARQLEQIRDSSVEILGRHKLGRGNDDAS